MFVADIQKLLMQLIKKNTKNLKDQIYDERTHAGPMGMGLTKSYQINNQKICVYNTINGQEQIILKSLDKVPFKKTYKKLVTVNKVY